MKILFISSECYPFIKVGGLGDVAGSLPKAMDLLGVEMSIAMPYYGSIKIPKKDITKTKNEIFFTFSGKKEKVTIYKTFYPGTQIPVYLFKNTAYISKKDVYPKPRQASIDQFVFFSRAILKFLKTGCCEFDLLHLNDWPTGIIPGLLKTEYSVQPVLKEIATLLTIHNLGPQGITPLSTLSDIELSRNSLQTLDWDAQDKNIDLLLQGIVNADVVNTVSPTYAKEIMTKEYGEGLDQILKSREGRVFGVLNGIDYTVFNPETDSHIHFRYNQETWKDGKEQNKLFLQHKLKFQENIDIPLLGVVTRLSDQKGINLIIENIEYFVKKGVQLVVLGTGYDLYEKQLAQLSKKYPQNVHAILKYDAYLAREIFAGVDIFLIPSRFEPCGLTQLISLKYGTVPIVRATGGLKDTIEHGKSGFIFENYGASDLLKVIKETLRVFKDKKEWAKIVQYGMEKDFSWKESAKEYLLLYQKAIKFKHDNFI